MSWSMAVAANCVMALGCALQASIGMGLALFAVPFLLFLDPRLVPGPMLLAGSVLALASALRERHALRADRFAASLLGLAVGTAAGALALRSLDGAHLDRIFARLGLLAVALSRTRSQLRPTRWALLAGGGAAGVMGTMAGIHGPPIALVFQNARPDQARAMLGAFFFVAFLGSVAALSAVGLFGVLHLKLTAWLLPGVAAGIAAGPSLSRHVSPARLRFAILGTSALSACVLLLR